MLLFLSLLFNIIVIEMQWF